MPAPSLLQLAMATAVKHVKSLNDIGNLPYNLVRPILLKVDNPEKLHAMELLSPHLTEEDKELWLNFIRRDIPKWEQYDLPEKTHQWYEIYCDLREDVQRALDADAEKMKMALDGIKSERTRLTPKIIPGHKGRGSRISRSTFTRRPFSGIPSASVDKKKSTIFSAPRRNNALAVPTKHLSTRASQVKKAPISLIEEHRQPTEQPVKQPVPNLRRDQDARGPVAPALPRRQNSYTPSRPVHDTKSPALAEREARLRAIASGKPLPSGSEGTKKIPSYTRDATSSRPTGLKREAVSPPPGARHSSHSSHHGPSQTDGPASPPASARPVMPVRKRPDSVFIQPKRRRVV
ncbi:uncharacterized protein N7503_003601 [Penicillium pulvis]|uniref:uncharacterized protein n=1 Tax=Penicillium pulvis TaxID=1562058 RepID=UPI002548510F|nr:uncharacterized protein N7503_003601 [Penicillium pulvis]KAJ5805999.1 hypothetical protein N7503_003601 [Penicillium pulvis]